MPSFASGGASRLSDKLTAEVAPLPDGRLTEAQISRMEQNKRVRSALVSTVLDPPTS